MRKLKRIYLNNIYITILTITVCAILWTNIEWKNIVSIAAIPTLFIAALFDNRYGRLFK
ncbi:hypothetical protein HZY83_07510 [Gemella sp. GH3]|uniref:hypothetical protein n=1 Tax=unclassified Gemella TaxID=2624949 RepID=UPI0015D09838|nr:MULTISPECIES: hypothetical protein [unclassified Gemella]MBF0714521.1 hypothetical protein [Gemella sp. GH3.1]NYS51473.1 hypothetical protein [Gemella sp. GH3]